MGAQAAEELPVVTHAICEPRASPTPRFTPGLESPEMVGLLLTLMLMCCRRIVIWLIVVEVIVGLFETASILGFVGTHG